MQRGVTTRLAGLRIRPPRPASQQLYQGGLAQFAEWGGRRGLTGGLGRQGWFLCRWHSVCCFVMLWSWGLAAGRWGPRLGCRRVAGRAFSRVLPGGWGLFPLWGRGRAVLEGPSLCLVLSICAPWCRRPPVRTVACAAVPFLPFLFCLLVTVEAQGVVGPSQLYPKR